MLEKKIFFLLSCIFQYRFLEYFLETVFENKNKHHFVSHYGFWMYEEIVFALSPTWIPMEQVLKLSTKQRCFANNEHRNLILKTSGLWFVLIIANPMVSFMNFQMMVLFGFIVWFCLEAWAIWKVLREVVVLSYWSQKNRQHARTSRWNCSYTFTHVQVLEEIIGYCTVLDCVWKHCFVWITPILCEYWITGFMPGVETWFSLYVKYVLGCNGCFCI